MKEKFNFSFPGESLVSGPKNQQNIGWYIHILHL